MGGGGRSCDVATDERLYRTDDSISSSHANQIKRKCQRKVVKLPFCFDICLL